MLVIWLTGVPCSGKTTISNELVKMFEKDRIDYQQLDGDIIRNTPLSEDVGFTPEDRAKHIRRMGWLSKMLVDHGIYVICSFVSPNIEVREQVRSMIGEKRFVEVYVECPIDVAIERDVKGMYKKALAGEIANFTGVDAVYEPPETPNVWVHTDEENVNISVDSIYRYILAQQGGCLCE